MCQQCVDLVNRFYPHLSEDEKGDLLMSATAFPFAHPETLEKQLRQLRRRTDGTLLGAQAYTDRSMTKTSDFLARRRTAQESCV